MKILLFKLSSLGDLIHTFPALTDALAHDPSLEITWVVENAFADVPLWHPAVKKVIVAPLRQIKKNGWNFASLKAMKDFIRQLRAEHYDVAIDAQGLYKSALLMRCVKGKKMGYAKGCARESVWWLYQKRIAVDRHQHAIFRIKALLAGALNYQASTGVDYGLHLDPEVSLRKSQDDRKAILFAHGTTWPSKHYPDSSWKELVRLATEAGYEVWLPQVTDAELKRAQFLKINDQVKILPKMSLSEIKSTLQKARGVIAVDTGLAHIAAALSIPCVTIYGPTDSNKIGTLGQNQVHLSAHFICAPCNARLCTHPDRNKEPSPPCFGALPPDKIWNALVLACDDPLHTMYNPQHF